MKKLLSLLLCFAVMLALAACGGEEAPATDTATSSASQSVSQSPSQDTDSDGDTDTSSQSRPEPEIYDPEAERLVIMDDSATGILIADLSLGGGGDDPSKIDMEKCIIWEWDCADAEGARLQGKDLRIDEAGIRYSSYWEKDVVIFSGSGGWVGILDYATKEVLFEDNPGNGPHSVELLPNGDLVVACSGNGADSGAVIYYPLSEGKTSYTSEVLLDSAHGICYDPQNEVIWALGGSQIVALTLRNGKLSQISGMGVELGENGGHDLVPVYGQPGKYWVSTGKRILQFDANEGTVTSGFSNAKKYTGVNVKGIAWFEDGTMILTAHDQGGTGTYRSSEFRILYKGYSTGKVKQVEVKEAVFPHREGSQTYKIHTFSKDYQ